MSTTETTSGTDGTGTEDPRARLVRAGLEVIDELPLPKVLAGATTAAVAERAGVTTGSFFHHFRSAAEFADAIVLSLIDPPQDVAEVVDEVNASLQHIDLFDMIESSVQDTWQIFVSSEEIRQQYRVQMHLWAHSRCELSEPHDGYCTVGDVLRENFRLRQEEATTIWRELLARTDRAVAPPFDLDRLATVLIALFQGLVIRREIDPDAVDDALLGEAVRAVAATLTVPRGSRIRLSDLTAPMREESGLSPQARTGVRRRRETRARITAATQDLFTAGWESVSASEVAETAGVSPQTVLNVFGSVRAVAATCFARHVAGIREVATRSDGPDDPLERLRRTLVRLAEAVAADPQPARALLGERLETISRMGDEFDQFDIRVEVPLADSLLYSLERLDLGPTEPISLAATMINFVLAQGLRGPTRVPETVDMAMRLLPPEAFRTNERPGSGGDPAPALA